MSPRPRGRRLLSIALIVLIAFVGAQSAFAQPAIRGFTATPLSPSSQITVALQKSRTARSSASAQHTLNIIVKIDSDPLTTYKGDIPGMPATSPRATGKARIEPNSAASKQYRNYINSKIDSVVSQVKSKIPGARMTQRLDVVLGGAVIQVPEDQLSALGSIADIVEIYPDELQQLDTDRSPGFIGAPTIWRQLGGQESAGEGVIVGILDTGIWPEHPSFSDPDPLGKPYAPPPASKWHGSSCQFSGGAHPGDSFTCNNKLIGAQRFMSTYEAFSGLLPGEFTSARDDDGHGTHTASTSAGNANVKASIFGIPRGIISGIAPRAYVAAYKVCGADGCYSSDSVAAIQQAILDGVDVINFSIGGGNNPYSDSVEQAFLNAYEAGIFVAASAGNSGPTADTTGHRGPWVTTVAASSADRAFLNSATVTSSDGAKLKLTGTSITKGTSGAKAVVVPSADPYCIGPFAPGTFTDKIVVCERGGGPGRAQKGYNVLQGGAAGMIIYNNAENITDLETDNHFLPVTHIQYGDGQTLLSFISAHPNVTATISAGVKDRQKGDVMASFSSRGGPAQSLGVSKPDITAPGVQILAGHTPQSVDIATGPQGELFQAIAGTSMSSPHIAGSGALLKALHPDWTPGQIKSALMTTAETHVYKEDGKTHADAFDDGSGRVDLGEADDPGLAFDVSGADYRAHPNDLWNVNYPSVYIPAMPGIITVQRTAHSLLRGPSFWKLDVKGPSDLNIDIPHGFSIARGGDETFSITIDARDVPIGEVRFATLYLKQIGGPGASRELHIPITIVRQQAGITLDKTCDPASLRVGASTTCTITMTNTTMSAASVKLLDKLPSQLQLNKSSVVGASASGNSVVFSGSLAGAAAPDVAIGTGSSPAGYLPLSLFGITPVGGVGDDSITNFNVPPFTYAGQSYSSIGFASNGYVVVGGGSSADVSVTNQSFPSATRPNNTLAPFWTDLDPSGAGALRIATLSDGADTWLVLEWEGVKEFSSDKAASFQIWIGIDGDAHPGEDISFTYDTIEGDGDLHLLTVGAENYLGTRGANYYYAGPSSTSGTLPSAATELRITGTPGAPGETRTITFSATGKSKGSWTNYALLNSSAFQGTSVAPFSGKVTR